VAADPGSRPTYVLVDGENIDATLGNSILGRRPQPSERPRWERLLQFVGGQAEGATHGLFFLAVTSDLPMSFVQALIAMGYRPVPLRGDGTEKVVDIAIQRTLRELKGRTADVVLVSNDGDFVDDLAALLQGDRRVAVIGFDEFRNNQFAALEPRGLQLYDLEHDVDAFQSRLPRVRIIPIDEFDPRDFL
jgi:uncharacterized protein